MTKPVRNLSSFLFFIFLLMTVSCGSGGNEKVDLPGQNLQTGILSFSLKWNAPEKKNKSSNSESNSVLGKAEICASFKREEKIWIYVYKTDGTLLTLPGGNPQSFNCLDGSGKIGEIPFGQYNVLVQAKKENGDRPTYFGEWANVDVKSSDTPTIPPGGSISMKNVGPPTLRLESGSSGIKLNWDKVGGVSSYKIFRRAADETSPIEFPALSVADNAEYEWTDSSAIEGKTYYYSIGVIFFSDFLGKNKEQEGTLSSELSITVLSSAKDITAFSLDGIAGTIDEPAKTIGVTMPFGTDLEGLVASFNTTGTGIQVAGTTQISGDTPNDFTNPVVYTVTGANGSSVVYTVKVKEAFSPAKAFTAFSIAEVTGEIDETVKTITITMPFGTDLESLVASFETTGASVQVGATNQTSGVTLINFTNPVTYTVTAEDGSTVEYNATVTEALDPAKEITEFFLEESQGIIDGPSMTISVQMPFGTTPAALVATFKTTGNNVKVGGVTQSSGNTANDFTNPVTYKVTAKDGSIADYTVTVTNAPDPGKAFTRFSLDGKTGTINEVVKTIEVKMPFGTDVANLVATFSATGKVVTVGGTLQTSGTTANDFAAPLLYKVTAADGTIADYIVTVIPAANPAKKITAFSFPEGTSTIDEAAKSIAVTVPFGTNVTSLVATFSTTGKNVQVGATNQISGVTSLNYTNPVTYAVTAEDSSTADYIVTVTQAPNQAKEIKSFSFPEGMGTIDEAAKTIAVTVPFGMPVTALVATFSTAGTIVKVSGITQYSGTTANNFSNPVIYTVNAEDGSTVDYTVTVTVAKSPAKALTAFSFPEGAGTIDEAAKTIAVTVPFATNVTGLVATFSTTGAGVQVGTAYQTSGTTVNDFTNPVIFSVTADDSSTVDYAVTVTVAKSSAKAITAFSFPEGTGTIDEAAKSIAVTVPFGIDVTGLVATFSKTGAGVQVGTASQTSGTTANDFTNPVIFRVTADDSSTADYTVTVVVAKSPAKALTAFSFPEGTGTIDEAAKSIAVAVPFGTDVTSLVATFSTTGKNVQVGATNQISGVTSLNYTNPVIYAVAAEDSSTADYIVTVTQAPNPAKEITNFSFPEGMGTIDEAAKTIAATVPFGTSVTALVATFSTEGTIVKVSGITQTSGTTANNFSNPVIYTVSAEDGSTVDYTVTVSVAKSPAKTLTAFSFPEGTGTINEAAKTIAVTVPFATNVTGLVATFSTTGARVLVGTAAQTSGTTANNFTNAAVYTVMAEDGSTTTYTVTVVIPGNPAKKITAFSFPEGAGTIDEAAKTISVTVPFATNVTGLVATFSTTGAGVQVATASQTSGTTANDFTNPVIFRVTADDSSTADYTVIVVVAKSPAKALTAFSFPEGTGTIDEAAKSIAVNVPFGTDVTSLVATFVITGQNVQVGATNQISGDTSLSFTTPVIYRVIAADGSTAEYTVTVVAAKSPAKKITSFSFPEGMGTIDELSKIIAVTVPFGTSVTGLVATFSTTGNGVNVEGSLQASGTTANDFSNSVIYRVTAADGSTADYIVTVTARLNPAKAITSFSFPEGMGTIDEPSKTITVTLSYGTSVTGLVATFSTTGKVVKVEGTIQTSGTTVNDFSNSVTYRVTAEDSSTTDYTVTVIVALSSAKAITDFFLEGVAGTIDETAKTINVTMPFLTDVTGLVATFATTGAGVQVGGISQSSGVTATDFTNPVPYTVTAADDSTADYIVTVVAAKSPAKALTAFSFPEGTGTIDDVAKTIAVTVPFGTNVTALVATLNTTGVSVQVGAVFQSSGTTANDFTSSVIYKVTAEDNSTADYTVAVTVALNPAKAITSFSFLEGAGTIDEAAKTIAVTVPFDTPVTALLATFTTTGKIVKVSGTTQTSGTTANDFTTPVIYRVTAEDSSTADYTVTIIVRLNPAKAITSFSFPEGAGTIDDVGKTIAVAVPFATNVTRLVATFTTTGNNVQVGATNQISGVTSLNFTNPVTYTVTAEDDSTADYTVTVTVGLNPAKAITSFSFPEGVGAIDETAKIIDVSVPFATNVTSLVATFANTGTIAKVSGTTQVSGTTTNDFTNPLLFTVTAEDESTVDYTVTVTARLNPEKKITSFSFPEGIGTIDEAAKAIAIKVPFGTNITSLVPAINHTGSSVQCTPLDLTTLQMTCSVTAEDNSTDDYTVAVTVALNPAKAITSFSFLEGAGTIDEAAKTIAVTVPFDTPVTALLATFTTTGKIAKVSGTTQTSGTTANDFTTPVIYRVTAEDSSTADYTVTITVRLNPAKAITSFSFPEGAGTIDDVGKTIAVAVPFATNVTSLVATFTTTGNNVQVGATNQISGVTSLNFTNPVTYTVTAEDDSTADYTVTVTVGLNPAKAITSFSFPEGVGAIDETAKTIEVSVPFATNVTSLVATFANTGTIVKVSGTTQVSGTTTNDFTNPLLFTVTAEDESTVDYTVTVTARLNPEKKITSFSFPEGIGTIDEAAKAIAIKVPFGTNVTSLVPVISHTGSSVQCTPLDLITLQMTCSVTAEDNSTADYTVTVTVGLNPAKVITSFSFPEGTGTTIDESGKTIGVSVPFATNVTALVATFTTTGTIVKVSGTIQTSGTTANDFTNPVIYTVHAADGSTADYTVTVTVGLNPAKAITDFSFLEGTGTIDEAAKTIAVGVPFDTNVTSLVATFTTTGKNVQVGATNQISGVTSLNFTNPVTYTVTAEDDSTADYTVTVTVGLNPAKEFINFSFPEGAGTIDEAAKTIAVTVPFSTPVTALVATFTTSTEASVFVGATTQVSGTTANDFTDPVVYSVIAADGSTVDYTVTVVEALSPAKAIIGVYFPAGTATINEAAKTIGATVPFETDVTSLIVTLTVSPGASVQSVCAVNLNPPIPCDFTTSVTFKVTAADGSTADYIMTVTIAPNPAKAITEFTFLPEGTGTIIDEAAKTIAVTVKYGTAVTALVATFTTTGASVQVGAAIPVSGVTSLNFTNPVIYRVTAADGSIADYTVTVTVALNTEKALTNFSLPFVGPGIIDAVARTFNFVFPFGSDVRALVASFTNSTGAMVHVGGILQISGFTPNDFTNPVIYTVTAENGSTADYTVTVTVPISQAKALTAFSFQEGTGTIVEAAKTITVTVPFGTSVTALVATFNTTGLSVQVGGIGQSSGFTPNDFTNPVDYTVIAPDGSTATYTVTVTLEVNNPPVANISPIQPPVYINTTVFLDGSESSDPDGDSLTYQWSMTKPASSSAVLQNPTLVNPFFAADVAGIYQVQLTVNDGIDNSISPASAPITVTIDITLPDTSVICPTSPTSSRSASFSFSSPDTTVTNFECQMDGAAYAACSTGESYASLTVGTHTFKVRAVDPANNKDDTPASCNLIIESVVLSHSTMGETGNELLQSGSYKAQGLMGEGVVGESSSGNYKLSTGFYNISE